MTFLTKEDMEIIQERQRLGQRLLEQQVPDWPNELDFDSLNMTSIDFCVLGQIFCQYSRGLFKLDIGDDEEGGTDFGFDLDPTKLPGWPTVSNHLTPDQKVAVLTDQEAFEAQAWEYLTECWVEAGENAFRTSPRV